MEQRTGFIACFALASVLPPLGLPAQNLIPNGDFEQYSVCPTTLTQIDRAVPWTNAMPGATNGPTPDYFNACAASGTLIDVPSNAFGTEPAHSGSGYAGVTTYHWAVADLREYMEIQLTQPLVAGQCYELTLYLSLSEFSEVATGDMGVYLSDTAIVQTGPGCLPFVPQLDHLGGLVTSTTGWTMGIGLYEAVGGEAYIVIGSFHDDQSMDSLIVAPSPTPSSYYYIDDVSLVPVATSCGSVGLGAGALPTMSMFPNPAVDELVINTAMRGEVDLTLRDAAGRIVLAGSFAEHIALRVGHLPGGLYTCELRDREGSIERAKLLKQ